MQVSNDPVSGNTLTARTAFLAIAALNLIVAVSMLSSSLAGRLGFESAMLFNALVLLQLPWLANWPLWVANRLPNMLRHSLLQTLALIPAFITLLLGGLGAHDCGWWPGIGFWLLIPAPTLLLTAALFEWCQQIFVGKIRIFVAYYAVILGSVLFTLVRTLWGVQVYAFNVFIGYVPGPIYDPALSIEPRLLWHRLLALVVAGVLVSLVHLKRFRMMAASLVVGVLLIAASFVFQSSLGFHTNRTFLQEQLGGELHAEGIELYYDLRLETAGHRLDELVQDASYWRQQIVDELDLSEDGKVKIYVYPDAAHKKRLMGAGRTFVGDPINGEIHMLPVKFPNSILLHEMVHILAMEFGKWGTGFADSAGLLEGTAVAIEGGRMGYSNHQWSKAILMDESVDVFGIMDGLSFYRYTGVKSYSLAGSIVEFLLEQYGPEAFKSVYRTGHFEEVYSKELPQLMDEWRVAVDQVELSDADLRKMKPALSQKSLFQRRCPHEVAHLRECGWSMIEEGDDTTALDIFIKSYTLAGGHDVDLYGMYRSMLAEHSGIDLGNLPHVILAKKLMKGSAYAWKVKLDFAQAFLSQGHEIIANAYLQQSLSDRFSWDALLLNEFLKLGLYDVAQRWVQSSQGERIEIAIDIDHAGQLFPALEMWLGIRWALSEDLSEQKKGRSILKSRSIEGLSEPVRQSVLESMGRSYYQATQFDRASLYFAGLQDSLLRRHWVRRLLWEKYRNRPLKSVDESADG